LDIWNEFFHWPMVNGLVLLYDILGNNFGWAIIALTIIVRVVLFPLTMQALHSNKAMQALQPQIRELQKRYAKDKKRLNEETMKLYAAHKVNPVSGCLPMLLQLPVMIGLYGALIKVASWSSADPAAKAGATSEMGKYLYSFVPQPHLPVYAHFAWLDLGRPDPLFILPILAGAAQYMQSKMAISPTASADTQQRAMNQMTTFMPLLTVVIAWSLPSGLALYWVVTTLFAIVQQYFATGWGSLFPTAWRTPAAKARR